MMRRPMYNGKKMVGLPDSETSGEPWRNVERGTHVLRRKKGFNWALEIPTEKSGMNPPKLWWVNTCVMGSLRLQVDICG